MSIKVKRIPGKNLHKLHLLFLASIGFVFLLIATGCETTSHGATLPDKQSNKQVQNAKSYGPVAVAPTLAASALHGPTNFQLRTPLNFSNVSGTTVDNSGAATQLDDKTIKTGITAEIQRLLFTVSKSNAVSVYLPGAASPIPANVTQRPDGSTAINYTHTATSITILFAAALYKDQIIAKYEQKYSPLITENAKASDVIVTFTTDVQWVTAKQIPAAPINGQYQITKNNGIDLSWDGGQNAVAYHVYRMFPDQDQQFQLLGTVRNTSYSDTSSLAQKKLTAMGIAYAIFSVGPTGIENPVDTVISIAAR